MLMYNTSSTLIAKSLPKFCEVVIAQKSIQMLDTRKGYFYEGSKPSHNGPLIILPVTVKPKHDNPFIECGLWERAAVSVFKSSVIFMTADQRGVQLDCQALSKRITWFVQWKDFDVLKPNESHFNNFLGFIKQGIMCYSFREIVEHPNKIRKAIFNSLDSISLGSPERYIIGDNLWIESGKCGNWNILKGNKLQIRSIYLEQITAKTVNL